MVKIVIITSESKFSGKMTKFWTNSFAYHIGFVDLETDTFYDMFWIPRKSFWSSHKYDNYQLYDCDLTVANCEYFLKFDSTTQVYSFWDYALFGIRGILHFFGKNTTNAGGWICSEMVNVWLWRGRKYATPFNPDIEPPSPADFEQWLKKD
jgi:hypothetical protein